MKAQQPAPSTPFQRMIWQQENCIENVTGYAVGIASAKTERAAYLSPEGELTNHENKAAILPREEAKTLMESLHTSGGWYDGLCYKIAFLVPVSEDYPLNRCTFAGY